MSDAVELTPDGTRHVATRVWVPEAPVALEFNGLAYAVMMASPTDLEDFVTGFALTEGLARQPSEIRGIAVAETGQGWIVRASLSGLGIGKLTERVRTRVAESSCGLCGIENLAEVSRPLPPVAPHTAIPAAAIFAALSGLREHQPLNRATGAAHAAAWVDGRGAIAMVREDVGRHNAMDKLIGAMARSHQTLASGFVFSTARCSYEIVEKTVRAGATTLACVSLPTSLAVERAKAAGLSVWALARDDSVLLVHDASA